LKRSNNKIRVWVFSLSLFHFFEQNKF
jgi:hypothetical protein